MPDSRMEHQCGEYANEYRALVPASCPRLYGMTRCWKLYFSMAYNIGSNSIIDFITGKMKKQRTAVGKEKRI